ncbi:rho GTPase-activating protein 7 isoform X2 [Pristis pectinata]|uniref:rho GTPase-activating protein 7 isoform X2 n=1 Tax=Pristis pectinata TaxID=685728 RepID=UPI00223E51B2|nr:rho GTPase-activating protein 7 isoform X2 [Pristis pectinata]
MAHHSKSPLRRSFSEHIKDSTNKAWDIIWKNTREKRLSEIEAKDACDWLRAAGFPQYSQLFEASQFPVDIEVVKNDHEFLDRDATESLCRRLKTLNKCAMMKLEIGKERRKSDESEDDEPCAISNKWTFQRDNKRWSRVEALEPFHSENISLPGSPCLKSVDSDDIMFPELGEKHEVSSIRSSSSSSGGSDNVSLPKNSEIQAADFETSRSSSRCSSIKLPSADSSFSGPPSPNELSGFSTYGKCSKTKGKGLLKKMERLRLRSSSQKSSHPKLRPFISAPVLQEGLDEEKLRNLNCVDIAELDEQLLGLNLSCSSQTCSSSSQSENSSTVSTPSPVLRTRNQLYRKEGGLYVENFNSILPPCRTQKNNVNERGQNDHLIFHVPLGHKPGTFPKALQHGMIAPADNTSVNWRTGSFHGYRKSRFGRDSRGSSSKELDGGQSPQNELDNRISIYDNVPGVHVHLNNGEVADTGDDDVFAEMDDVMEHVNGLQQLVSKWTEKFSDEGESDSANDSTSPYPSSPKDIHLEIEKHLGRVNEETPANMAENSGELDASDVHFERDSGVGSSLKHANRQGRLCWPSERNLNCQNLHLQIDSQSAAQLNLLQKLALLKLTALMDKYSPSSKQGWNWTVPKFIRKIKAPDFKDRVVFGVPLLLNMQRTGHPLPKGILQAMYFLRSHCLDQVGLFRKSGVKSRIQALREMNESSPDGVSYEGQSAFDVADMVKQYFRDLPEPLFTTKLSESFLHIYQYLPTDQQLPAVQSAILLLPDENREALQTLLFFLCDVVACVNENQMTPTNLAVCLAPSLFHLNTLRRESTTSRVSQRKYSLGKPDQRDLSENLAATQGLAHMIAECTNLFLIPEQWAGQRLTIYHQFHTDCADVLNDSEWYFSVKTALQVSLQSLLKEAKEKFKGWISCSSLEHVEIACKKVDDNHPLRLWKVSTEVEKSPEEILKHLLREHHLWEKDLFQSKVIETLDDETEIYHYTISSTFPHPDRDYVVLRTWQTDSQTGLCMLAATSVDAKEILLQGVQANVITSQYHIEPVGPTKSKLIHICRIDTRGRIPEWYNKVYGYRCAAELLKIRDSFTASDTELRETNI